MNIKTKIVLLFVLITAAIGLLSYQFLNSDLFSSVARRALLEILNTRYNIKADFDFLEFDYFPPAISATGVTLHHLEDPDPFFRAKNLKISLRMFQIMFGDIMLERISAVEPLLDIDISRFKKMTTSQLKAHTHSDRNTIRKTLNFFRPQYFSLTFRGLDILNGNFRIRNLQPGTTLDFSNVNVDFASSFFTRDQLFGSTDKISYGKHEIRDVKFNAGIGKKSLKIYFLTMNLFSQTITFTSGMIKNFLSDPTFEIDYFSHVYLEKLAGHLRTNGSYEGEITVRGTTSGNVDEINATGKLKSSSLILRGLKTESLSMNYNLRNRILSLEDITTTINNGKILARGKIELNQGFPMEGKIQITDARLEDIFEYAGVRDSHVKMPLTGNAKFTGQLGSPFSLHFASDFSFKSFRVFNESFKKPEKKQILFVPSGRIRTRHTVNESAVTIHQTLIRLNDSNANAKLHVTFPYDNSMSIAGTIDNLNLKSLKLLDLRFSGIMSGPFFMNGPFNQLVIFMPLTVRNGKFNNFPFHTLKANGRWFKKDIAFNNLISKYKENSIAGDIIINLADNNCYSVDLGIKGFDIETLPEYNLSKPLEKYLKNFQGAVQGNLQYQKTEHFSGALDIRGENILFMDIPVGNIDFAGWQNGSQYSVKKLRFARDRSFIELQGKIGTNQAIKGSIVADIHSNDYSFLKNKYGISDAYIDLFSEFAGTFEKPEINLRLGASPFMLFDSPVGKTSINVSSTGEFLAHGNFFDNRFSFIISEAAKTYDIGFKFEEFNSGKILDMVINSKIGRKPGLNLFLTASGNLIFDPEKFRTTSADVNIQKITFDPGKHNLTNNGRIHLSYRNNTLSFPDIHLKPAENESKKHLSMFFKYKKSDFSFRGEGLLDTAIVQPLFDNKTLVIENGTIRGDWSYSKVRGREILLASITPIDNKFSVFNSSVRLSAIHGLLKVANNQLLISDLKGKWGIGNIALDGSIRLNETPEVNLDITFRNGQFFYKDSLDALLSGNLNLLGNAKPYALTGNISTTKLNYTGNIDWKGMLIKRKTSRFLPREAASPQPLFAFNISLHGKENLFVKNNLADIELEANLLLHGTSKTPLLKGDVNTITGHFYYQKNIFEMNSFHLAFSDPLRINPYYSLVAQTQIEDIPTLDRNQNQNVDNYIVNLTTSGQLADLTRNPIVITSSPPLSRSDLAEALTFGVISKTDSQAQSVGEAAVYDLLSGQLQEALERETKKYVKGLSVKIESRFTETSRTAAPALTLEKDLTDRISVRGTRVLDDSTNTGQEYKLEFRITPNLSITSGLEDSEKPNQFNETFDFELKLPFGR